ncbi:hypothetical protein EDB83DRAFT_2506075 [Lactarius deliciosus]|nr:hypothetical protein EDB83DRAFT_2506075 [Lactarius deliciosus]
METLCLACSSSLPPRLWKHVASLGQSPELLFFTQCCGRPICPSCLTANPRLARYNPCLLCLGGMGAVDPQKVGRSLTAHGQQPVAFNVDGAVRDEDVFVVGDEDSEEHVLETNGNQVSPGRYYIQPDDTLLGISLRLGINGRALCKLNNLPPSTLNTTPYLLHTRTFLVLPESHLQHATSAPSVEEDARQTRVRAQIALQRVTRETDWGIAQAYVALAEDSDSKPDVMSLKLEGEKSQRGNGRAPRRTLEERAVDLYLDDDEWECREIAEGRGVTRNTRV